MPHKGWRHSEQSRQKMSLAHQGRLPWNKGLHVYCGGHRFEEGNIPWNKGRVGCYKVKANLEPSPVLSYILGVLAGDGWVVRVSKSGTYRVGLHNSRKAFADEFAKALENIGLHCNIFPYINRGWGSKLMYRVQASSRMFVDWYDSLSLADVRGIECPREFIKGFFQSEGSVCDDYVRMYNNNRNLLEMIAEMGEGLGFNFHLYTYTRKANKYVPRTRIAYLLDVHGGRQKRNEFLNLMEIGVGLGQIIGG